MSRSVSGASESGLPSRHVPCQSGPTQQQHTLQCEYFFIIILFVLIIITTCLLYFHAAPQVAHLLVIQKPKTKCKKKPIKAAVCESEILYYSAAIFGIFCTIYSHKRAVLSSSSLRRDFLILCERAKWPRCPFIRTKN